MGKSIQLLLVAASLLAMSANAVAATRYISDELSINMRRGPSTSYSISKLLDAGARVQTLSEANGWTQVRTEQGLEGYVLTRFLSNEPAARTRIAEMEAETAKLKEENVALREELSQEQSGTEKLGKLRSELIAENQALKDELEEIRRVSANAISLNQQNREFREQLLDAESEVERLRSENKSLQSRREGMKIGALILIGGVILGLVLPLFRRRRKSSWDSL